MSVYRLVEAMLLTAVVMILFGLYFMLARHLLGFSEVVSTGMAVAGVIVLVAPSLRAGECQPTEPGR